jgi:peptidoglycan/LPS O-acetylase OafA/YrhL
MKDRFYHPELDQLRFFAFLAVFLHHFFSSYLSVFKGLGGHGARVLTSVVESGGLGVDLFFCLSSFLITTLLLREFALRGTLDVRAFWMRRILRIWPLYYMFVALSAVVVPWFAPGNQLSGVHLLGFIFFAGNWACVAEGYPNSVAGPLWSVSIEEQFYLAWPLLLLIVSCRRLLHLAVLCLLGASAMRVITVLLGLPHPAIWCNTIARLDPIAMGALVALLCHQRTFSLGFRARCLLAFTGGITPPVLLALLGESCWSGAASLVFYPAVAFSCVLVLLAVYRCGEQASGSNASRLSKALVYLGRISYGLYVFHVLGLHLSSALIQHGDAGSSGRKLFNLVAHFTVGSGLTLALAAGSYEMLEKPFLRLKARFAFVDSSPEAKAKEAATV